MVCKRLDKRSFKLTRRHLRLVKRLRFDKIAHRLRLRQIDAAVEKGAHGEFARLGQPRAAREGHLHNMAQNDRRAVARNLDHVVGGVGMRLGEEGDDNLVETFAG